MLRWLILIPLALLLAVGAGSLFLFVAAVAPVFRVLALAAARLQQRLAVALEEPPFAALLEQVQAGAVDPYAAAEALVSGLLREPDRLLCRHGPVGEEV